MLIQAYYSLDQNWYQLTTYLLTSGVSTCRNPQLTLYFLRSVVSTSVAFIASSTAHCCWQLSCGGRVCMISKELRVNGFVWVTVQSCRWKRILVCCSPLMLQNANTCSVLCRVQGPVAKICCMSNIPFHTSI